MAQRRPPARLVPDRTGRRTTPRVKSQRAIHRALAPTVAVAGFGILLSACGGSGSPQAHAADKAHAADTTTSTTAPAVTTPTVMVNGQSVTVPTDSGGSINPLQDTGQQVILTSKGVLPRTLYAALNTPVVFTNLSSRPLTLTIEHVPGVRPQTVAPGGTYSWVPTALAFDYRITGGDWGNVQVGQFGY